MFKKLKESAKSAYKQGKDKVKEVKKEYKDKQQNGWLKEVVEDDEQQTFKNVNYWFTQYEPSAIKKEQKEESKSQQKIQQKMNEMMVNQMTKNVIRTLMESLALATEAAAQEIQNSEPLIFPIFNGVTSIFLTYRFQYKNKKKFIYLRGVCVDKICNGFIKFLDEEAKKVGQVPQQIDEEAVQKIIDRLVDFIANEIDKKKDLSLQKFKQSALFQIAEKKNDDIDQILHMILDIIETFAEQKINDCLGQLRKDLPQIFRVIVKNQNEIRANMIYQLENQGDNHPEYDANTKQEILKEIDEKYYAMKDFIAQFIGRFFGIIINNSKAKDEEEGDNTSAQDL